MKAIAAMSLNRVIGREGKIPWHLPEDFRWFKKMTLGHAVLMGRKTFASLGKPLPGRLNLVVSRGPEIEGVEMIRELPRFDPGAYAPREIWVIGGEQIYRQLLPRCSDLYLTVVRREVEGDVTFPEFEPLFEFAAVALEQAEFEVRHYTRHIAPADA
jgi:dihydrofolate reductase